MAAAVEESRKARKAAGSGRRARRVTAAAKSTGGAASGGTARRTVRRGSAEELVRRVRESFLPMLREMQGFRGYYLLDGGPDVLITISMFDSADEALASLLGILWEAALGQPALASFLDQNWLEGLDRSAAPHFTAVLHRAIELGLADLPALR